MRKFPSCILRPLCPGNRYLDLFRFSGYRSANLVRKQIQATFQLVLDLIGHFAIRDQTDGHLDLKQLSLECDLQIVESDEVLPFGKIPFTEVCRNLCRRDVVARIVLVRDIELSDQLLQAIDVIRLAQTRVFGSAIEDVALILGNKVEW